MKKQNKKADKKRAWNEKKEFATPVKEIACGIKSFEELAHTLELVAIGSDLDVDREERGCINHRLSMTES